MSGINLNLSETAVSLPTGTATRTRWQIVRPHLVAVALFTGLTIFVAFPAILKMGESTPGNFFVDRNQYLWNMWWFSSSIFDNHVNPFVTNLLYYPYGAKLFLQSLSPYNLVLGWPLYFTAGRVASFSFFMLVRISDHCLRRLSVGPLHVVR